VASAVRRCLGVIDDRDSITREGKVENRIVFEVSRFGGGSAAQMHPVSQAVILLAICGILLLPRRYVMVPLLISVILLPMSEGITIGGMNFQVLRIMIFFGWVRMLTARFSEKVTRAHSPLDTLIPALVIVSSIAFCLLWGSGAVISRIGQIYSIVGIYFLLRYCIRDAEDVERAFKTFALICVVVAALMVNEQRTGHNLVALWGNVPDMTVIREGRLRSQGPFAHPILAGTFGGTLVAPFLWLFFRQRQRLIGGLGVVAAIAIAITAASSTAAGAGVAGAIGLCLWPLRRLMQPIRWGIVGALVGLHMIMKAPVWALIERIDLAGGSTSYHRFNLIDQFIRRVGEWALVGVKETGHWGYFLGDTANQYVDTGVTGGILSFGLFIAIISYGFRDIGRARRVVEGDPKQEWLFWMLGAALFSHVIGFFGIVYFDATIVSWYVLLVMIAAMSSSILAAAAEVPQTEPLRSRVPLIAQPVPTAAHAATAPASRRTNWQPRNGDAKAAAPAVRSWRDFQVRPLHGRPRPKAQ